MYLNYQEVNYNIEARGAQAVVAELAKAGQLPTVVNNIQLGDDNWIAMAQKLAKGGNVGVCRRDEISPLFGVNL